MNDCIIRNPHEKIKTLSSAREWSNKFSGNGNKLVVTNGCFEILHRGHIEYLYKARSLGDGLLVALNNDESVRRIKGNPRPVFQEKDRAFALAALEAVDVVVLFSGIRASEIFSIIRPDIYVKGGDYTEETLDREEYKILKKLHCPIRFIEFIQGYSTSTILENIRRA